MRTWFKFINEESLLPVSQSIFTITAESRSTVFTERKI